MQNEPASKPATILKPSWVQENPSLRAVVFVCFFFLSRALQPQEGCRGEQRATVCPRLGWPHNKSCRWGSWSRRTTHLWLASATYQGCCFTRRKPQVCMVTVKHTLRTTESSNGGEMSWPGGAVGCQLWISFSQAHWRETNGVCGQWQHCPPAALCTRWANRATCRSPIPTLWVRSASLALTSR